MVRVLEKDLGDQIPAQPRNSLSDLGPLTVSQSSLPHRVAVRIVCPLECLVILEVIMPKKGRAGHNPKPDFILFIIKNNAY